MRNSQSAPGLGKGINPLQMYLGESRSMLPFSPEKLEAEHLYYAAISTSLTKGAFTIRGQERPKVHGDNS